MISASNPLLGISASHPGTVESDQHKVRLLLVTTTRWGSTAVLAVRLKAAGFDVVILGPPGRPATLFPSFETYPLRARSLFDDLRKTIGLVEPAFIVPADDRAVAYLHDLHRMSPSSQAAKLIRRSLGSAEGFGITTSRARLLDAASDVGMLVPQQFDMDSPSAIGRAFGTAKGSLVFKIDGLAGGQGVIVAGNRLAGLRAWAYLHFKRSLAFALKWRLVNGDPFWLVDWRLRRRARVTAQQWIMGQRGEVALFCLSGKILGASIAETESSVGETGPSTFVRLVERPALLDQIGKLVAELGLSGFYGFDFIVNSSGQEVLIEMNPRVTALSGIQADMAGTPIEAFSSAFTPRPVRDRIERAPRSLCAHFPIAWLWNSGDPRLTACAADIPDLAPDIIARICDHSRRRRSLRYYRKGGR